MSETTARFALPFILPGQAQKEHYHNEALVRLDMALHASVEAGPLDVPPSNPQAGESWIVGASAGGDWAGKADNLASSSNAGWRFFAPTPGMMVWRKDAGHWVHWTGAGWSDGTMPVSAVQVAGKKVVGERQQAILSPSGGTTIDQEARQAVTDIIAALMSHGLIE